MPAWNVRLLTASYSRGNDVVIELYGRTDRGKSITVRYEGFKPYFYLVEPNTGAISELKSDDIVLGVEDVELFYDGVGRRCSKITIRYPWMVPDYRKRYSHHSRAVLAADIPFAHRFIYDFDLGGCFTVEGDVVDTEIYTTDIVVNARRFSKVDPFKPGLKILSFDIENSIQHKTIYTICGAISEPGKKKLKYFSLYGDERSILKDFIQIVRDEDPDVLTGYNIDGYDIPVILERCEHHKIEGLDIGRNGAAPRSVGGRFWRLTGRIVADAWWNAKMELRPKQETLNAVAKLVLGQEKDDVNPAQIDAEWAENPARVIKYCKKDAELALRILKKIEVLEKNMDIATVSKLPLDDVLNGRTSNLIDSILIREADARGIGVPLTHHTGKTKQIEGGYVHTINPGVYDWVCVLDFKSMYPSLMIAKNICFTTLSKDGTIVSPVEGIRYLDKNVREGLLPGVLEKLMKERDDIKARIRASDNEDEKHYLDGLQYAIKILMNSFYGVFASSFYRFTNPKIGESITAFARENTKGIIGQLDSEGLTVVYGDTDSVFFQSPKKDMDGTVKFGKEIAKRYTKEGATLEFEAIYNPLFSHGAKKRYVGKKVWPDEDTVIRGYETRRSDSFEIQTDALSAVFDKILEHEIDEAVKLARDIVADIARGNADVDKLVISRTCKDFRTYKDPDGQTTVQVAKKLMEMGYDFVPGMKVSWVVTDATKSPLEAQPYISGARFEYEPDYDYYARRVAMTLSRVTDVFGWDMNNLMTGSQQKTLFSDTFQDDFGDLEEDDKIIKKRKEPVKVKKTDKKLSLDDFL